MKDRKSVSVPNLHRVKEQNAVELPVEVPLQWMIDLQELGHELTEPGVQDVEADDLTRIAIREFLYGSTGLDSSDEERVREVVREELVAWDEARSGMSPHYRS